MSFSTESTLNMPVSDRDHAIGSFDTAPITLVEYGDYECPHCMRAYSVVKAIRQALGADLAFVFRNFPLANSHPNAQLTAESAEAAGAQGRFWPMHEAIFERKEPLSPELLVSLATTAGVDVERLGRDLETGAFTAQVREDFMSGVRSGVNGTPTFFVNGLRYDGFADFDSMMNGIDSLSART